MDEEVRRVSCRLVLTDVVGEDNSVNLRVPVFLKLLAQRRHRAVNPTMNTFNWISLRLPSRRFDLVYFPSVAHALKSFVDEFSSSV